MTSTLKSTVLAAAAALATGLSLAGCDRAGQGTLGRADGSDTRVAGARPDAARTPAESAWPGAMPQQQGAPTGSDTAAANPSADAGITASVNAALSRDPVLGPLSVGIEVETVGGEVALRGSVPSAQARDRATQLVRTVAGVRSVDNQLEVGRG